MSIQKRTGTQSIERAILLLKEIATHGKFGWRPGELSERCNLDHGTTHRILACLVRERLVQQRASTGHYLPGPLIFELGLAIPHYQELQERCQQAVDAVAAEFKATSVFYLRSGSEWVCSVRAGPAVYGGTILEVGTRRPLLSSVGGVAMLMTLESNEMEELVSINKHQLRRLDDDAIESLEDMLHNSKRLGYAFNKEQVTKGVHSFGVPAFDSDGQVFGSLTLANRSEALPAERGLELIEALSHEARKIEQSAEQILPI